MESKIIVLSLSFRIVLSILIVVALSVSCGGGGAGETPVEPTGYVYIETGSIATTCSEDLAIFGNVLYVADGPSALKEVDISDKSLPRLMNTIPTTYAFRVYIYENHLYLCDASGGLKVFSLSTSFDPMEVWSDDTKWATSAEFHDGYMYVGDYYGGLRTYNIANPANPEFESVSYETAVRDLAIVNDMLLVSQSLYGPAIYELETPSNPVIRHTSGNFSNYEDIVGYGEFAIIGRNDDTSGIYVYWVENSNRIQLADSHTPARFVEGLTCHGTTLAVACGEDGVILYSMDVMPVLKRIDDFNTPGYARRVKMQDDHLYVADMSSVQIYRKIPEGGGQ